MMHARVRSVLAVVAIAVVAVSGCTKGQTLRGTSSVAVKAALADNHVNYQGSITCTGNDLPISCTGTSTDGRPIAGTLSTNSGSSCVLVVTVAGKEIAHDSGARCK
jgi:hypothetical protein